MIEKTEFLLFQRVREIGPGWEVRKIRFRAHNFAFIFFTVGLILTYLI